MNGRPYVGYIRVSRVSGRSGDRFHSPRDQEAAIRRWVADRGGSIDVLDPELDRSGGDDTRPVLESAIRLVESGSHAGLVVAYLSRAARSVAHTLEIYERIERAGGVVVAVAENIDTASTDGRFMRTIHAAVAEQELDRHRERFALLRAATVERGVWRARVIPRGYMKDPETRKLVPGPDADRVRDLFRSKAAGATLTSLAAGVGMTTSGVRQLLRNRVYLGEVKSGEVVNRTAHEPLVTVSEFEAAQGGVRRGRNPTREPALLARIVRCGSCGRRMSRAGAPRNRGGFVYVCPVTSQCPRHTAMSGQRLDEFVEPIALQWLQRIRADVAGTDSGREDAVEALRVAEAELAAYLTAVSAADVGPELFASGARARQDAVAVARRDVAKQQPPAELRANPVAVWPDLSATQKNALLRGLLEAVVVWPVGRDRRYGSVAGRVQIWWDTGDPVLPEVSLPPEIRRLPHPIARLDDTHPAIAGPLLHDGGEDRGGIL